MAPNLFGIGVFGSIVVIIGAVGVVIAIVCLVLRNRKLALLASITGLAGTVVGFTVAGLQNAGSAVALGAQAIVFAVLIAVALRIPRDPAAA